MNIKFSEILLCGLGGSVGAVLRYKIGGLVNRKIKGSHLPYATLLINISGSYLFAFICFLNMNKIINAQYLTFVLTGVLGAFTTFSAFSYENYYLLQKKKYLISIVYILISVMASLFAVYLALYTSKLF